jgi:hypothetical protein
MSLVNVLILKNLNSAADKSFVSNNENKTSWKNKFSLRTTLALPGILFFWNLVIYIKDLVKFSPKF